MVERFLRTEIFKNVWIQDLIRVRYGSSEREHEVRTYVKWILGIWIEGYGRAYSRKVMR